MHRNDRGFLILVADSSLLQKTTIVVMKLLQFRRFYDDYEFLEIFLT